MCSQKIELLLGLLFIPRFQKLKPHLSNPTPCLYDRARTEKWRIDPVTFSTLIKIHGQSGYFDGCLNVYEEMKAIGAKPNLVIYNTLFDAIGRARRPWQAKKIYRQMISNELSPNWVTYATLLRAYGRARYCDDAL
ncbi:hypothetical protein ACFX1X_005518 [Malus domestica]